MKFTDACESGESGWALRLSGTNLLISKHTNAYIYTNDENIELKSYKSEKYDDWMPLPLCPDYIPKSQNNDWHRKIYRKFRKEELSNKIQSLEKGINK